MCILGELWTSFEKSLKALQKDIDHANELALQHRRECDTACIQMQLERDFLSSALFFLPGATCSLASSLGLLRILVFKVYSSGLKTKSTHDKRTSLREFYGFIYPSLLQLGDGIMNKKYLKQGSVGDIRTVDRVNDKQAQLDEFRCHYQECDVCMEDNEMMVLPDCAHVLCIKCFRNWNMKSSSCPFCRGDIKRVSSTDLWVISEDGDAKDTSILVEQDIERLFKYTENLPFATPQKAVTSFKPHKNNQFQVDAFPYESHMLYRYGDGLKVYIMEDALEKRLFYMLY